MASIETSLGKFSWTCEEKLDPGSICIQTNIIDTINLLFLSIFYLFLLIPTTRKHETNGSFKRDLISIIVSVCCAMMGIAYIGLSLLKLAPKNGGFENIDWMLVIRGLIWGSVTVSLYVKRSKWVRILCSVWWVCFFLLVSGLNIEILIKTYGFEIIDMVQWFVTFLLFFCAMRNFGRFDPHSGGSSKSLCEPLILEEVENAGFLSKLTFSWVNSLLSLGYSKPLNLDDIPYLVSDDEANLAYEKFAKSWDFIQGEKTASNDAKNSVIWAISRVYIKEMIVIAIYALVRAISVTLSPLLLYGFVNYANREQREGDLYQGLILVGCLIVAKMVESIAQRHWFFDARRSGMKMRSALMVAIYKKQLKLSSLGRRRHSTGEIVNYTVIDAYRLGEFPWWFTSMWSQILQVFLSVGLLFALVGLGALPGLVPLVICGLLNVPFAKMLQKCQSQFMIAQDERLRLTSEILNNMKVIKLQSWEEKFKTSIESLRDNEFKWLAEAQFKKVYNTVMYWMSPTLISSIIFVGVAVFNSKAMNASTVFTILATLRTMAEPVRMIPEALSVMIQVKVSFDRINAFLVDDELENRETSNDPMDGTDKNVAMSIRSGDFKWDFESITPTLRNINLEAKRGQKIAVCGPVGAGKSSLLYAILGEIPKSSGHVNVNGSTAYVAQTSWIQSGTIQENILFGKPMDKTRYEKAIKACALDKDIDSFSYGDLTEIGQRGINMSGGQKQRIQLARAVFNDSDIYLLDDPFSAVDAHTASTLFNDCVMTALAEKTVILVTHQVEFLSNVDKIVVMECGIITQSGTYNELLMTGTPFDNLVNAHKNSISSLTPSNDGNPIDHHRDEPDEISLNGQERVQLTSEEEKEIGDVGWKPFWDYIFVSKGSLHLCLGIIAHSGFIALQAMATYWIAFAIQVPSISNGVLIGVYTGISTLSTVFVYLRSLFAAYMGLDASKSFFAGFTNAIFKAPMLFFDSTPVGRIFTRASSDLSVVDFDIPFSIIYVVAAGLELITTIIIMASITWQVLIVAIFAIVATAYFQGYYLATARELIRINGTTKAPVMNYASETSLGVVTIRAFNKVDEFFQNYLKLIDTDAKLFFYSNASVEWLVLRIEALQNLTLFTSALLLVLLPKGYISPALVGLSLSYALALTGTQVFLTRWYCNLSNYIISVERIKQFMNIPPEPPAIVDDMRPLASWPSNGTIVLQDLKMRYRPNAPLVLKGISCTFKEGTRVGVVGRTGSGKTTLISALFRLVEPASGKILIDELDICLMGLKDLRMKLSIIPQEPTLFKGSVRTNLDPLGLYSDTEIWQALEKCQLKATISALPNLLDSSVSDDGENWSVGQRQLFCLGRVLLKRNKILVLDEATASIDSSTDAILQKVIRQEFSNCTVITVAHRVPTVIDSHRVMVLSYGRVLEYDEPSKLMETDSSFSKLVGEYWSSCRTNSLQNLNNLH